MTLVGKAVDKYQIIEEIGHGGMASVYRAYQPSLNRYVAIKVLSGQLAKDETFRQRFAREAKVIAQLSHPNILPIYDFGEQPELQALYIWPTATPTPLPTPTPTATPVPQAELTVTNELDEVVTVDIGNRRLTIKPGGRGEISLPPGSYFYRITIPGYETRTGVSTLEDGLYDWTIR